MFADERTWRWNRKWALSVALASLIPSAAFAAAVQVSSVESSGSGCNDANLTWQVNPEGDFEVAFQEMNAIVTAAGSSDERDCALRVVAVPPRGHRLAIAGSRVEVASRFTGSGTGVVTQRYALGDNDFGFSGDLFLPREGGASGLQNDAFWVGLGGDQAPDRGSIPEDWMGECGRPTTISGELRVAARTQGSGTAEIYVDRGTTKLKWAWKLVRCTDDDPPPNGQSGMEGPWAFQYRAANGRTLEGAMQVAGSQGTYRLRGANWQGRLRDLAFDGQSVRARWEALGQSGWARFVVASDGASFEGSWGYDGQSSATGFWRGQRNR